MVIRVKRIYDPPSDDDGVRVLVDRLWPRGISKERAQLDAWLRDVAPSQALCKWYDHIPQNWPEFKSRYCQELASIPEPVAELNTMARAGAITLLFAARDTERNNAVALRDFLEGKLSETESSPS